MIRNRALAKMNFDARLSVEMKSDQLESTDSKNCNIFSIRCSTKSCVFVPKYVHLLGGGPGGKLSLQRFGVGLLCLQGCSQPLTTGAPGARFLLSSQSDCISHLVVTLSHATVLLSFKMYSPRQWSMLPCDSLIAMKSALLVASRVKPFGPEYSGASPFLCQQYVYDAVAKIAPVYTISAVPT